MKILSRLHGPLMRCLLAMKSAAILLLASPGFALSPGQAMAFPGDSLLSYLAMDTGDRSQAIDCLTDAIYYEAAFEPAEGQEAVAQVVLNRVRDPHYPDTVCGVVYQGWERKTGCQFSFVCDGSLVRRQPDQAEVDEARKVAMRVLGGETVQAVGGATHYHTDYVSPYWAPSMKELAVVGHHIFYQRKSEDADRSRKTFVYAGGETTYLKTMKALGA